MYCLKCRKETKDTHVFCDDCLEVMKRFPVRSDIHVQIPYRKPLSEKKAPTRRKIRSTEEQLLRLRNTVKRLAVALACCLLLLALSISLLFQRAQWQTPENTIGKNYNTVGTGEKAD